MDRTMSEVLMKDFEAEQIGHKPAPWCKACIAAVRQKTARSCGEHKYEFCKNCRTKITEAHTCLDFVGHADVRARLCEADPEWTWEPFDFPGTGSLVVIDGSPVGLWITLTVGGVSKPGYGSCDKGKSEAVKELIGDALRNAGQSFGIAWKLWAKGERGQNGTASGNGHAQDSESFENATPAPPRNGSNGNGRHQPPEKPSGEPDPDAQPYADEASQCTTLVALGDVNKRAREKHKLASFIRNPATGGIGGLGQYINWRRQQLTEAEAALRELEAAVAAAGMEGDGELDEHVRRVTGADLETATAAQLRDAVKALATVAVPA